MDWPVQLISKK